MIHRAAKATTNDSTIRGSNFIADRFHGCDGPRQQVDVVLRSSATARNMGLGAFEVGDGVLYDRAAPDRYHEPPAVADREAMTPTAWGQL